MRFVRFLIFCCILFTFGTPPSIAANPLIGDYVIVGVGTAGAVVAKKLSDDKVTTVIALHNGPNLTEEPLIKFSKFTPITVLSGLIGPPLYLSGETIFQTSANNQMLPWVMAIPLGGATSINAGAYCRGTNQVYSQWEAIAGPLWSVNRITNIYKSLEHYTGQTTNPAARGFFGPLNIRQVADPTILSLKFSQAISNATGFPIVLDLNDPNTPIGVTPQVQYTQSGPNGIFRVSSANAFLNQDVMTLSGRGVNGRKLSILYNSTALRVIWNGNVAVGVEFLSQGKMNRVYARKGVIVTAGLYSSSFLLHSGIGPANLLNALGIPVVFNNPNVGQGLADQPQVLLLYSTNPFDTPFQFDPAAFLLDAKIKNLFDQTRMGQQFNALFNFADFFRQYGGSSAQFSNQGANNNSVFAEISWFPAPGGDPTTRELRFSVFNPVPGLALALFDLVQPQSRGSVSIDTANPTLPPVINYGVLSNPNDLALYVSGFQIYIKAINAALQAMDPLYQLIYPDPSIIDNVSLLTDFIKSNVASNMSFESHCRMAPLAQGGVVDSTGHVYGTQNLIVADDSIVPVGMDGSSMASAYLIAENIGRILLNQPT